MLDWSKSYSLFTTNHKIETKSLLNTTHTIETKNAAAMITMFRNLMTIWLTPHPNKMLKTILSRFSATTQMTFSKSIFNPSIKPSMRLHLKPLMKLHLKPLMFNLKPTIRSKTAKPTHWSKEVIRQIKFALPLALLYSKLEKGTTSITSGNSRSQTCRLTNKWNPVSKYNSSKATKLFWKTQLRFMS